MLIISHRGAWQILGHSAPENSLESIRLSKARGFDWVELDVTLAGDNKTPLIFHDDQLDRCTDGSGFITDKTTEEMRSLRLKNPTTCLLTQEKIPTLAEALDLIIELNLSVNIELKPTFLDGKNTMPSPEKMEIIARKSLDIIKLKWKNRDNNRIIISSFSTDCLRIAAEQQYPWKKYCLFWDVPDNWRDVAKKFNAVGVNFNADRTPDSLIRKIASSPYQCLAYTVNDTNIKNRLRHLGVDGIFSDRPHLV